MKGVRLPAGQALTEFLVLALALVPIFLILPLLGKYQDIGHAAQVASRYVAFDATLHNDDLPGTAFKSAAQLEQEVRRRFFGNVDAPIKTDDAAGNVDADRNPLWTDAAGKPLLQDYGRDVCVTFGIPGSGYCNGSSTPADGYGDASNGVSPFLPLDQRLGMPDRGIFTGAVHVRLADIPNLAPFDALHLTMTRHTSVVPNPWTADSVATVEARTKKLVPISKIEAVAGLVTFGVDAIEVSPLTQFHGPELDKTVSFASDLVPPDRLCNDGAANCPAQQP